MMGAATEKARLPRFSLVLGIESCTTATDLGLSKSEHDGKLTVLERFDCIRI